MSTTREKEIPVPAAPPPPLPHKLDEAGQPLLMDHHAHIHHHHHHHAVQPVGVVDLEAGSKRRVKALAIAGMVAVLVAGVLRRFPITSCAMALAVLLVFFLYSAVASFVLLMGSILSILYNASDQAVFCPDYPPDARQCVMLPSSVGLPSENLRLYAADNTRLHAVFVGQVDAVLRRSTFTILYLHGNAGNFGHRLANVCGLFNRIKCNILLLEYRGFGFSSGYPSELGLYQDAAAALSYLRTRQDIDINKIVVFGRSLGGGVGIELASRTSARQELRALIVENTFTSIPDMAKALLPKNNFITKLPLCCYKNQFLSRLKMLRTAVPTLIVSGLRDALVPPHMSVQLHQACCAHHKRMVRFSHGTHNDTWRCPGYYLALKYFLDEVTGGPVATPVFPPGVTWLADAAQTL